MHTKSSFFSACLIVWCDAAFVSVRHRCYLRNSFYQSCGVSSPCAAQEPPFSPPCRSLSKIIGVHWERYWFSLAVLREKVSFIFSKIQTKEEKIDHVLKGLSNPIYICFLYSSPFLLFCLLVHFCLFSSTLFCLSLLLACQSSFCLCSFLLNSPIPIHTLLGHFCVHALFMLLSQCCSCLSSFCFICQASGNSQHWPHTHPDIVCICSCLYELNLHVHTVSINT